jgi:hypothetical protein
LDNAISESFVASLKCELLYGHRFPSREAARIEIFNYIEGFCYRVRRHSSLGHLSPDDYEQATMEEAGAAQGKIVRHLGVIPSRKVRLVRGTTETLDAHQTPVAEVMRTVPVNSCIR